MKRRALIIGANGAIGQALQMSLATEYDIETLSRQQCDYSDQQLAELSERFKQGKQFALIINCIGVLHDEFVSPEKRLSELTADGLAHYFYVNTILPSLCIKHFHILLIKSEPSIYVNLSAMVGSITDNRSGGWYGYRSSKAALNMMVKSAAIELARVNRQTCIVVMHPGTTQGALSRPYATNVLQDNYYTPQQSAQRILSVIAGLNASNSGQFYNWDGEILPW